MDAVVILSSSDEACLERVQNSEHPIPDKYLQKQLDRWKKENPSEGPGLADFFRERCGWEPIILNVDDEAFSIENAVAEVVASVSSKRTVCNFLLPAQNTQSQQSETGPAKGTSGRSEEAAKREADER